MTFAIGSQHTAPKNIRHRGTLTSRWIDSDKVFTLDFVQCIHCGGAFPWLPPGMKLDPLAPFALSPILRAMIKGRGWCMRCWGPVCGRGCAECVYIERLIENLEKGLPWWLARITPGSTKVYVGGEVPA